MRLRLPALLVFSTSWIFRFKASKLEPCMYALDFSGRSEDRSAAWSFFKRLKSLSFIMLKQIASEARGARASHFERSRAWFKRAMKREARARACFEARIVALKNFKFFQIIQIEFSKWFGKIFWIIWKIFPESPRKSQKTVTSNITLYIKIIHQEEMLIPPVRPILYSWPQLSFPSKTCLLRTHQKTWNDFFAAAKKMQTRLQRRK